MSEPALAASAPDGHGADELIARGERAMALLADPLVAETFAALEASYIARWRDSSSPEAREVIWLLLQNLAAFRESFEAYIRFGKFAAAQRAQRELAKKQDTEP